MFTSELIELARRKERLIARSDRQRMVIADACLRWKKPLAVVDRGIAIARYLQAHPLVLGAGVAAFAIVHPRNLLRWAGRGLFLWRTWRSVNAWMQKSGV
jgi:hypothetical protein